MSEAVEISKDELEELQLKLCMYRSATAWMVRELAGGDVLVPAEVFDMAGTVMFKISDDGVHFRTFTQVDPVVN